MSKESRNGLNTDNHTVTLGAPRLADESAGGPVRSAFMDLLTH
jgi:hypothetical protein